MAERNSDSGLRSQFLLRPDVVFLNHGSFGACPKPVFEEYQRWQRELESQPVEFLGRRCKDLMQEARAALGAYLHADADDLVYVPNATTGLNIVAHSLDLRPGDEVLGNDHEYGAMERMWRFVCAGRGARYVRAEIPLPVTSVDEAADRIWSRVTPRTRVLFLSHITSPTALTLPVEKLIQRARDAGILTVIDGAHVPGQIPLSLTELGADFYSGNLHKWLCAPKGSAFLYARRDVQPLLEPLVVSWGWEPEKPGPSRFIDEQEWQGTRDIAAFLSVPAAIRFQEEHNWRVVRRDCHELLRYARQGIAEITGLPQICPDSKEWTAQMASFPLPACDAEDLKRRLYDDYRIEVPIVTWQGRQLIRVSVQGYNTREDIDTLLRALRALLA